jgi:hypothetical protein
LKLLYNISFSGLVLCGSPQSGLKTKTVCVGVTKWQQSGTKEAARAMQQSSKHNRGTTTSCACCVASAKDQWEKLASQRPQSTAVDLQASSGTDFSPYLAKTSDATITYKSLSVAVAVAIYTN